MIYDPSFTFPVVPSAEPASCVEKSLLLDYINVPDATVTG